MDLPQKRAAERYRPGGTSTRPRSEDDQAAAVDDQTEDIGKIKTKGLWLRILFSNTSYLDSARGDSPPGTRPIKLDLDEETNNSENLFLRNHHHEDLEETKKLENRRSKPGRSVKKIIAFGRRSRYLMNHINDRDPITQKH